MAKTRPEECTADERRAVCGVDKHRLDEEWTRQANLYQEWAEAAADLRERVDETKRRVCVTRAEVELDLRQNPKKNGMKGTPREDDYKLRVETDERVQECERLLIKRKHLLGLVESVVGGLDQKKRALENLVMLEGRSYFAQPKDRTEGHDMEYAGHDRVMGRKRGKK